jgi:phenylalanyl-tRNA synthetase beta subunit
MHGGFRSENLLDDALLIALVETGVPIWALDAERVDGTLGVRVARAGERLGRAERAPAVVDGRLVVADAQTPLAVLFGELAPGHGVTADTRAMRLFSVQVAGVPSIHVEDALWQCADVLVEPA